MCWIQLVPLVLIKLHAHTHTTTQQHTDHNSRFFGHFFKNQRTQHHNTNFFVCWLFCYVVCSNSVVVLFCSFSIHHKTHKHQNESAILREAYVQRLLFSTSQETSILLLQKQPQTQAAPGFPHYDHQPHDHR
jgi:fucose permease